MNRIAAMSGSSLSAVREELWPILLAIHDQQLSGDPSDCTVAWALDLEAEDHLALHGLASKNKKSKQIIEKFNKGRPIQIIEELQLNENLTLERVQDENSTIDTSVGIQEIKGDNNGSDDDENPDESQTTLDRF